jgi:hypothetical protein
MKEVLIRGKKSPRGIPLSRSLYVIEECFNMNPIKRRQEFVVHVYAQPFLLHRIMYEPASLGTVIINGI